MKIITIGSALSAGITKRFLNKYTGTNLCRVEGVPFDTLEKLLTRPEDIVETLDMAQFIEPALQTSGIDKIKSALRQHSLKYTVAGYQWHETQTGNLRALLANSDEVGIDKVVIDDFAFSYQQEYQSPTGNTVLATDQCMSKEFHETHVCSELIPPKDVANSLRWLLEILREAFPKAEIVFLSASKLMKNSQSVRSKQVIQHLEASGCLTCNGIRTIELPRPKLPFEQGSVLSSSVCPAYINELSEVVFGETEYAHGMDIGFIGGGACYKVLSSTLRDSDIQIPCWFEQRIDTVIERDVWKSKVPLEHSDIKDWGAFGKKWLRRIEKLTPVIPMLDAIVVDAAFMLETTIENVDPARSGVFTGRPNHQALLMEPNHIADQLEILNRWVKKLSPRTSVILYVSDSVTYLPLTESGEDRIRSLIALATELGIETRTHKWDRKNFVRSIAIKSTF
ncbi:hypothetical protein [Vibrio barjaei]|uniref:hypothetical protein n=1 Tax=Vibrio barjaei TaxID=1676683 RepID=UPI002283A830|nr:hypothetical protein [Vibrio barjaei]MCY9872370.1 hypothetical protein [Vibrio barjaei]